jgi:hypothetical protein
MGVYESKLAQPEQYEVLYCRGLRCYFDIKRMGGTGYYANRDALIIGSALTLA